MQTKKLGDEHPEKCSAALKLVIMLEEKLSRQEKIDLLNRAYIGLRKAKGERNPDAVRALKLLQKLGEPGPDVGGK